jgi:hypothetical protein
MTGKTEEPATGPYPEPVKSTPHPYSLWIMVKFYTASLHEKMEDEFHFTSDLI